MNIKIRKLYKIISTQATLLVVIASFSFVLVSQSPPVSAQSTSSCSAKKEEAKCKKDIKDNCSKSQSAADQQRCEISVLAKYDDKKPNGGGNGSGGAPTSNFYGASNGG